jgi:glycosyltransferase involved in cell wall biosynthesis
MRRYRVAMLAACPFPAARGTPIRILRIAEELARRGHDVDVITYHLGTDARDAAFRTHRIPDVRTYQKESPGPSYQKLLVLDPLLALKLLQNARRKRYDVIHAHHVEGLLAALPAARIYHLPVVFDVHTLLESELPFYQLGLSRALLARLGRLFDSSLPRRADHVIAVSEEIRSTIVDRCGVDPCRVSLIPNGVEMELFPPPGPSGLGITADVPTVVYAGNMASYQGVELLLSAFAGAARQWPGLRLRILTDGSFEPYALLSRSLGIDGSVEVTRTSLEQLPQELSAAHVAANPRTACDGLPQKLLNYMAAGCPIVSFAGSARHLVHEENALIVNDGDVGAFSAAILRLVGDRDFACRLGRNGQSQVRNHMTWQHAVTDIERVYDRVTSAVIPN